MYLVVKLQIPKIYTKIIAKLKTAQCHIILFLLNSAGSGGPLPVFDLWILFSPQLQLSSDNVISTKPKLRSSLIPSQRLCSLYSSFPVL